MRMKPPTLPPAKALVFAFQGPRVPEGAYTFRLIKGKEVLEGEVELVADPRNPHPKEDRMQQQITALKAYGLLGELTYLADSVTDLRDQARERAKDLDRKNRAVLEDFADSLDELHQALVVADEGGLMAGREELRERLGNLFGEITLYDGRPSESQMERVDGLEAELRDKEAEFEDMTGELDRLNRMLDKKGLDPLELLTHEAWQKRQEGAAGSAAMASIAATTLLLGL
jgi:hypothetical protein